ncbi:MAG: hypothetical protein V2J25_15350 [Desulfatiglans sp.]|jgi:hypothetical protein|nr:hypothetical protein [Thermodesulfobacteriota bacterium]MEE4354236.1 hypothetical protein [Desulfatiglans sp.]
MEEKRHISKLQTVFDLSECGDLSVPENTLGRVLFVYDEQRDIREFKILNREMPIEMQSHIKLWLEENMDACKTMLGL